MDEGDLRPLDVDAILDRVLTSHAPQVAEISPALAARIEATVQSARDYYGPGPRRGIGYNLTAAGRAATEPR